MIFVPNQIFKVDDGDTHRLLWIDSNYSLCFTINIESTTALPEKQNIKTLQELLEEERLQFITEEPFDIFYSDFEISDKKKELRDARWLTIKDIVSNVPDIYLNYKRGELVNEQSKKIGTPKKTIYKNLKMYWKRGSILNALLPDYSKSGGKGKKKKLGEKKIGRPQKYTKNRKGVNVTEKVANQYFKVGYLRHKSNSKNKRSLSTIFELILRDFYLKDIRYEGGKINHILEYERPDIRQFRYWYQNEDDPRINAEARNKHDKGIRRHQLENRALLSKSDININAPGAKYQIDSTVADVYLVSEKNRNWIVGRPTMYFVIDVFSRQVVGMYVGLENASWLGATLALLNTNMDKVEYCKKYDIEISPEEWPAKHMPESILADQGEFKGYNADKLTKHFGIRVETTPAYRADLKGIVEQYFNVTNQRFKPFVLGSVTKEGLTRGGRDYRLDAKLTLREFNQVIIHSVLYHNQHHWQRNYTPDADMVADDVELIPNKIWEWGISNRSGSLKTYTLDRIMLSLLPQHKSLVTRFGIKFKHNLYYTSERAERERWFQKAAVSGNWRINIVYDPRDISHIYVINDDGSYDICELTEPYRMFLGMQLEEIAAVRFFQKDASVSFKKEELESKLDFNGAVENIINSAVEKYEEDYEKQTKSERLRNINSKRDMERDYERANSENHIQNVSNFTGESDGNDEENKELLTEEQLFLLKELEG